MVKSQIMRKITISGQTPNDSYPISIESVVPEHETHLEIQALVEIFRRQGIISVARDQVRVDEWGEIHEHNQV